MVRNEDFRLEVNINEIKLEDTKWKEVVDTFGIGESQKIMRAFEARFSRQFPRIDVTYHKGEPTYKSKIKGFFPPMGFASELEANLANAMWLVGGKDIDHQKFQTTFQIALTLLNVESEWRF